MNCNCETSTGICGAITRGTGKLSFNGYWEHPCVHGNAYTEYVPSPVKRVRVGHTCTDQPTQVCAVPQCTHVPERPLEWHETEYGKYYMDTQRHEGKV